MSGGMPVRVIGDIVGSGRAIVISADKSGPVQISVSEDGTPNPGVLTTLMSRQDDTPAGVTLAAQAYTTVAADLNKTLDVDSGGASDAIITLIDPALIGANKVQKVRKSTAQAGRVVIKSPAGVVIGVLFGRGDIAEFKTDPAGAIWYPVKIIGPGILGRSGVAVPTTGSVTENILATVKLPGKLLGNDGGFQFDATWSCTNNANAKVVRARLGGIGGAIIGALTVTSFPSARHWGFATNRGAENSQVSFTGSSGLGTTSSTLGTSAIDTTVDQDIVFTAQNGNAGDTITLERWRVEYQP